MSEMGGQKLTLALAVDNVCFHLQQERRSNVTEFAQRKPAWVVRLGTDCVEKVETWMRAILRSACLKAALSRSNAVQTPYEGHSLRGGSMMRSPASLLEQLTSTSAKTRRSVTTDFFNTICHEQTSRRSLDYLVGQQ
jgi:hypothetical protein